MDNDQQFTGRLEKVANTFYGFEAWLIRFLSLILLAIAIITMFSPKTEALTAAKVEILDLTRRADALQTKVATLEAAAQVSAQRDNEFAAALNKLVPAIDGGLNQHAALLKNLNDRLEAIEKLEADRAPKAKDKK